MILGKSIALTLPQEVVLGLTRADITLCDLILDLCRLTSKRTSTGAFYTCASQKWLSKRLGVTREWVSKCVNKLEKYGILRITKRRQVAGKWQTNIYRVGDSLKKGWKTAKRLFLLAKCRVNFPTHIVTEKHISRTEIRSMKQLSNGSKPESFDAVMAKMQERMNGWAKD